MKRGEVWAVAGGSPYSTKPRPAIVVQHDRFDSTDSITVCPLTSIETEGDLFRLPIEPSAENQLNFRSFAMVDKLAAIPRERMGYRIGRIDKVHMASLNRAILIFLGLFA